MNDTFAIELYDLNFDILSPPISVEWNLSNPLLCLVVVQMAATFAP